MKDPHVIQHRYLIYVLVNLRNTYDLHNIYRVFWYFSDRASQYIYLNINQLL